MIKIIKGNILDCNEDIIVHQVNIQGYMGGGIARQLANQYKGLEEFYSKHCSILENDYEILGGTTLIYKENNKIICNIFSQKPNFDTDYEAIKRCLEYVKLWASNNNLSIAIPYEIGCGIANGDWYIVHKIIEEVFNNYDVTLYKLEG